MHGFLATEYAQDMADEQPTQKTPKGYEIPVPTKAEVMGFFKKVAGAPKRP
jgi:hypothetical protein